MTTDRQRLIAVTLGRTPRTIVEIDDGYDFEVTTSGCFASRGAPASRTR